MVLSMSEDSSNDADAALVASILNKDRNSTLRFIVQYRQLFMSEARKILRVRGGTQEDMEDMSQIIFTRLFSNDFSVLRHYDASKGSLEGFLRRFARNSILSHLRRKTEIPIAYLESQVDHNSLGMGFEELALTDLINSFFALRPSEEREFFDKVFIEDRTVEEISKSMGLTAHAVYQRKSRMRRDLQEFLQETLGP